MNEQQYTRMVDLLIQGRSGAFLSDKEWREMQNTLRNMAIAADTLASALNALYAENNLPLRADTWGNIVHTEHA